MLPQPVLRNAIPTVCAGKAGEGGAPLRVREAPAGEIAAAEAVYFPGVDGDLLADTIAEYQTLGCWDGGLEISPEL